MAIAAQPRTAQVVSANGTAMFNMLSARKKSDKHDTAFETAVKQWMRLRALAMDFSVAVSGMAGGGKRTVIFS